MYLTFTHFPPANCMVQCIRSANLEKEQDACAQSEILPDSAVHRVGDYAPNHVSLLTVRLAL